MEELIEAAMARNGFPSESTLADRLRVSRQRLSAWKGGVIRCPDRRLVELSRLAGIPPEQIVGSYGLAWLGKKMDKRPKGPTKRKR